MLACVTGIHILNDEHSDEPIADDGQGRNGQEDKPNHRYDFSVEFHKRRDHSRLPLCVPSPFLYG